MPLRAARSAQGASGWLHRSGGSTITTVPSLSIIYASTSGHTEYALDVLIEALKSGSKMLIKRQRAEQTQPEDLLKGDVLLLASGTWNTGGIEGQLNPHMHALLLERAKDVELQGKTVFVLGLGDSRYRYTAKAFDHLAAFATQHGGQVASSLKIVNEPYGQEASIKAWAGELIKLLTTRAESRSMHHESRSA